MSDWKCCDCPKHKAEAHEILWSFTQYGNNPLQKEDALLGNNRCEEHFLIKQAEFNLEERDVSPILDTESPEFQKIA